MSVVGRRKALVALVVMLAGIVAAYALLVGRPRPEPSAIDLPGPPRVEVVRVSPATQALTVHSQGTVHPLRQIKLISQVAGRVESVAPHFAAGGFFDAGETLVKVEDVDYRLSIDRAKSALAAARQRLAEEQGRVLQAQREWRDLGSEQANALFLRKPQLASATAAVRATQADLTGARLDLQRTTLAAPFNGRVSAKLVDMGQYVTPGTVVAELYDTDVVEVRLPLSDRQVALLDLPLSSADQAAGIDAAARVVLEVQFAGRNWEWQGRVVRTDASIDIDSRLLYAVVEVAQPFAQEPGSERPPLAPGLFVHARISGRKLPAVTALPSSALRGGHTVLLVDGQLRVQSRSIHVLQSRAETVWVQGLETGERVIVGEAGLVSAGMQVELKEFTELAGSGV